MTTLAKIRAKLQAQENRTSSGGGTLFLHWNMNEDESSTIRFLPDRDRENSFFWKERLHIKLPFKGIKGDIDSRPTTVQVPCMEMWEPVGSCPVLKEIRPWFNDKSLEDKARSYWKKKTYVFQGFVRNNGLKEDSAPENPIRKFIFGPQLFKIVQSALLDPEMENMPTDYEKGCDFRIIKTMKGKFADYTTSMFGRRESPLSQEEMEAIEKYDLWDLKDSLPTKPTEAQLNIINQMFEDSVDGQPWDPAKYADHYRPAEYQSNDRTNGSKPEALPTPSASDNTDTSSNASIGHTPDMVSPSADTSSNVSESDAPTSNGDENKDPSKEVENILARLKAREGKSQE